MVCIALVGPNAIGKTTAVRRWCAKYKHLIIGCCCDSNSVIVGGVESKEECSWYRYRQRLVSKYSQVKSVVVVESASGYGVRIAREMNAVHWLIVTCGPEAGLLYLKERCLKKGKHFREDYWNINRLVYEGQKRALNYARKNLSPTQYTTVDINNQSTGWDLADNIFYGLFRKIHNQHIRLFSRSLALDGPTDQVRSI